MNRLFLRLMFAGTPGAIVWTKSQPQKGKIERDKGDPAGFAWETGMFAPAKPIKDAKSIAGTYEGGTSMSFDGGSSMVSKTLALKHTEWPDGSKNMSIPSTLCSDQQFIAS